MKTGHHLFLLGFVALSLLACKQEDGCTTKAGFLKSFDAFLVEFEEADKAGALTDESKQAFEDRYKGLINDCYKKFRPDLTLKERQDFWKQSMKFMIGRFDGSIDLNITDQMEDPFNQYLKDEVVAVVRESGAGFLLSLQDLMKDDLPKLLETFSGEFEKLGREFLENLFKDPKE